jgi:short-subunit dehydrogenase
MTKKVILVTGASSGIGKATALQLINEGYTVYGAARRIEKMNDIVKAGGHVVKLDVTDDESMVRCVNKIIEERGRIDVLFNNAGYGQYGPVEETSIDKARYQFEVNIFGLARMTQLVLPHMRKQRSGLILNTSSIGGKIYTPLGAWYHATKHALEGWSDALRLEVQQFGIDVVIIEPGIIVTEFSDVLEENMMGTTGENPYKDIIRKMSDSSKEQYEKGNGSPPAVIAKTVSKAIRARRPKTRYSAGKLAKPILFMRKNFSDRMFDRIVMSMVN